MNVPTKRFLSVLALLAAACFAVATGAHGGSSLPNLMTFQNGSGGAQTFTSAGRVELNGAFFQNLGTNGRTCGSCHQPGDGWTVSAEHLRQRFEVDGGLDPIFRTNDGAVCPTADVSTVSARRTAYSMLLSKGLIRVALAIPPNAEFPLIGVDDPYACRTPELALFR